MKIYISGKIKAEPYNHCKQKFLVMEHYLQSKGHEVINPFRTFQANNNNDNNDKDNIVIPDSDVFTRIKGLKQDIKDLMLCDAILMLNDYRTSEGAKLELHIAKCLNLKIFYSKYEVEENVPQV